VFTALEYHKHRDVSIAVFAKRTEEIFTFRQIDFHFGDDIMKAAEQEGL
jgi:hypothetical protein